MDGFNKAIGRNCAHFGSFRMHHWCPDCREFLGRWNRRHGRKIFIEIGVCHTSWISIMVVFGLIDLLINQRSGYFENFPPWDARQWRVVLCLRGIGTEIGVTDNSVCCDGPPTAVQPSTPVELVFTRPSQLDGKKNLQSFDDLWSLEFRLLMELRLFRLSLPPRHSPDSYAINLCPLPYLLAPRNRFSRSLPPPSTLFSTFWHSRTCFTAWQGEFYDSDF